jgi:DNA ligase (NAD+)
VLEVDPVQLDGTTVSQVTGHSLGFLNGTSKSSLGEIGVGTEVRIIKSGKIIPKVVEIVKKSYLSFKHPHNCPSCRSPLSVEKGDEGSELVCTSEYCGTRMVARINHYLSTFGVKGVAESTLTKLYETKLVQNISELYGVTVGQLTQKGFSERQALLIVARIWMCDDPAHMEDDDLKAFIKDAYTRKLKIPAWQLFASLGIPGAGKSAGQALVSQFGSFNAIRKASLSDLKAVGDVGDVTAQAIYDYFKDQDDEVEALLDNVDPQSPKKGKFTGQTFVFTGGFPAGKKSGRRR